MDSPWETYTLDRINSALSTVLDVSTAIRLETNAKSTACFEGQQPGHDGFRLNADDAARLIKQGCSQVIYPYLNGDELLGAEYVKAPRFIIDFGERDIFEARAFPAALDVLRTRVLEAWGGQCSEGESKDGKRYWRTPKQTTHLVAAQAQTGCSYCSN